MVVIGVSPDTSSPANAMKRTVGVEVVWARRRASSSVVATPEALSLPPGDGYLESMCPPSSSTSEVVPARSAMTLREVLPSGSITVGVLTEYPQPRNCAAT